ncbi:albumin-like [Tiliqua scincoides]|uniref:albumin-like n=1 Tax=Tiliqua scincoides TaxID=71010 RepID=UPI0034634317
MKWATFISCLFLLSFAESKSLSRKIRDAGVEATASRFATSPLTEFDSLALAWFSQYVQLATFEEVEKLVNGVVARSTNCTTYGLPDPRCTDSLHASFLNELCHAQDFVAKYRLTECCAKADPERDYCFIAHKNATPGYIPTYQEPDVEDLCRPSRNVIIAQYIYETARRYPDTSIPTILIAIHEFQKVIPNCCQDADKSSCFHEKDAAVTKKFEEHNFLQQYNCLILKKNGRKEFKDFKIAQLSQKHPQAQYIIVDTLAEVITLGHEECCRGALFQCFQKQVDFANFVCVHNDTTSTKVVECLSYYERESPRAELLPTDEEFMDNRESCQHYSENRTAYLAKFLYEYARRHPEFSIQLLLWVDEKYEALLEQCCKTEDAPVCLAQLDEQVNKHIAENLEAIKPYCIIEKRGDYNFQNLYVIFMCFHIVNKSLC